jgi:hypothetical protein
MSTVTLLDEIDDLERLLAGAHAPQCTPSQPGGWLRVADDEDEDEDDLFGEDDLGFDDIDEEDPDEDDAELEDDELAEDELDEEI